MTKLGIKLGIKQRKFMINSESLRTLRERTHLSISECKKALDEVDGNIEKAIELLQKKGFVKRVDAAIIPREGVVQAAIVNGIGRIVEINCETDFAAKSELFIKFVSEVLNSQFFDTNNDSLQLLQRQIGEKVVVSKKADLTKIDNKYSLIGHYNHSGRIAVLVLLSNSSENEKLSLFAENLAMHIAASNPFCVTKKDLKGEVLDKQKGIFEGQLKEDTKPKPQSAWPKIIEGKLNKWYSEVVLEEQEAIWESKKSIKNIMKEIGDGIEIVEFIRFERGG